jgi:hypothetical protein
MDFKDILESDISCGKGSFLLYDGRIIPATLLEVSLFKELLLTRSYCSKKALQRIDKELQKNIYV